MKKDRIIDQSTGIELIPGNHGADCPGNGEYIGVECCCDECDFFLKCFPEYEEQSEPSEAVGK